MNYLVILDYNWGSAEIVVYDGEQDSIEDYIEEVLDIDTSNIHWMLTDSIKCLNMKNKNKAKKVVKSFKEYDFCPKKIRDLRAVSFEINSPVGNEKYHNYLFQCTEWHNGEGLDLIINWSYENKSKEKSLSFNSEEIDGLLACLNELGFLEV